MGKRKSGTRFRTTYLAAGSPVSSALYLGGAPLRFRLLAKRAATAERKASKKHVSCAHENSNFAKTCQQNLHASAGLGWAELRRYKTVPDQAQRHAKKTGGETYQREDRVYCVFWSAQKRF